MPPSCLLPPIYILIIHPSTQHTSWPFPHLIIAWNNPNIRRCNPALVVRDNCYIRRRNPPLIIRNNSNIRCRDPPFIVIARDDSTVRSGDSAPVIRNDSHVRCRDSPLVVRDNRNIRRRDSPPRYLLGNRHRERSEGEPGESQRGDCEAHFEYCKCREIELYRGW